MPLSVWAKTTPFTYSAQTMFWALAKREVSFLATPSPKEVQAPPTPSALFWKATRLP